MLTAELKHVKTLDEFYTEIRTQQEEYHGEHYCAMHDAIRKYMKDCKSYKELGTHQGASAAAVLTGEHLPEYMELIDIDHYKYRWKLKSLAEKFCKERGIELVVKEADSTSFNSMSGVDVDMLMIDSLHIRSHMEKELDLHGPGVKKYIVAHDTTICQDRPRDALYRCLEAFCENNAQWNIIERGKENVGYTVLKKGK